MLQTASPIPTARRRRRPGFTLIELLISVGLLSLLLVLIGQLFQQSSTAVSTSVRTGAVIANARSVSAQMETDFKNLLGPSASATETGGFIVIVNQAIPNMSFPEPRNGGEYVQSFIRSDHIAFISNAPGNKPMSPRNAGTYGNDITGSGYTRITYGHARRTNRDGSPRTGANTDIGQANAELDRLATELILGRHALVFAPPPVTVGPNDLNTAADHYVQQPLTTQVVQNATGTTIGSPRLFHGLTDVTSRPYFGAAVANFYDALYNRDAINSFTGPTGSNLLYQEQTFVNNRLQVNPAPTQASGNNEAWRIAQTHGIFSPNCSEFIVQFAGDLDNDGELDTAIDPGNGAEYIIWYDAFNGNLPATPWAGMDDAADTFIPGAGAGDPNIFIFRVGDAGPTAATAGDPANSKWPVLIRVRYRLHDARGRVTSNDPAALVDAIDNDGDGLADGADAEGDEDQISGRWFEEIYRVARPALPTP